MKNTLKHATKLEPCPHCGKPDWCYSVGELSVCKRQMKPAQGWEETGKTDRDGDYYYAPIKPSKKPHRPPQRRQWLYPDRNGDPLVRVIRVDSGDGKKQIWQESWNGKEWDKGTKDIEREDIPIYKYHEVKEAIAAGKTIYIVEGEPCADALWSLGLPATTNIGGSGKWKSSDSKDLRGASVVLCPDRDIPGINHMTQVAHSFPDALWLYAYPTSPLWYVKLTVSRGSDVADWIEEGATLEQIRGAIEEAPRMPLEAPLNGDGSVTPIDKKKARLAVKYQEIEALIGADLKLNTLTQAIELKGEALTITQIQLRLALDHDIDLPDNVADKIIPVLAEKNCYSPAADYFERVFAQYGANPNLLNNAASEYLGIEDSFSGLLVKRFFIGVVARVLQPGCKLDTCLILKGKQGTFKSSFFQELMPDPLWFDDSLGRDVTNKDELAKLHRCVLMEWGEIEKAFSKRQAAEIKHFLTQKVDRYRPPYGREMLQFPRASVIVGTTNKEEFLTDETGDRRFWVVEPKRIDLNKLERDRDRLWAAAVAAYVSGEPWWLSSEEDEVASEGKEQYRTTHPWQPLVEAYLETVGDTVEVNDILKHIGLEPTQWGRKEQMEVTNILSSLGWTKGGRKRVNGRAIRPWHRPK